MSANPSIDPASLDIHRFWGLQERARRANVRLTADATGKLHLHAGALDRLLDDLDHAEQEIADIEKRGGV
jgi:hypothetical protein